MERETQRKLAYREVKQAAFDYLARTNPSSGKLRTKLMANGYPRVLIEEVMQELKERGYVDDHRLVAAYLRNRRDKDAESRYRCFLRLRQRGLEEVAIRTAFEEDGRSDRDFAILYFTAILDRMDLDLNLDWGMEEAKWKKLLRSGENRGFPATMGREIILSYIREKQAHE